MLVTSIAMQMKSIRRMSHASEAVAFRREPDTNPSSAGQAGSTGVILAQGVLACLRRIPAAGAVNWLAPPEKVPRKAACARGSIRSNERPTGLDGCCSTRPEQIVPRSGGSGAWATERTIFAATARRRLSPQGTNWNRITRRIFGSGLSRIFGKVPQRHWISPACSRAAVQLAGDADADGASALPRLRS